MQPTNTVFTADEMYSSECVACDFVQQFDGVLAYDPKRRRWMWNVGGTWNIDVVGHHMVMAKRFCLRASENALYDARCGPPSRSVTGGTFDCKANSSWTRCCGSPGKVWWPVTR